MTEFLMDYGLFAAKSLTILVCIIVAVGIIAFLLMSRQTSEESIEINKLNDKYEAMQDALEQEVLPKELIKQRKKQKKRKEKQEAKAEKERYKHLSATETPIEPERSRVFVVRFDGDMHASEADSLRECITAILSIALPTDEIVVILDSPGGLVHHYGLAASQLDRIKRHQVPLTVAVDLIAASGGYLMACVANKILSAPFAVLGSIGVFAQIPNFNRLLTKHDIDVEQHTAGEYKATLTMLGKNTDKARKKFKLELEDTHTLFKAFVKEHRPVVDVEALSTGEHWYGTQALTHHLVDEITTSDDYLLAQSKTRDIYEVEYVIQQSFSTKLSQFLNEFCVTLQRSLAKIFRAPTTLA
ncbi:MAG TPA: protease SohB [Gammaproteobacteria bacterium]|nr:protease SohB [Gammaproteobacteria bacterium]